MISYAPLWETMQQKGISCYALKYKLKIGGGTYNRLKADLSVSTNTIEMLCEYLDCEVHEVMRLIKEKRSEAHTSPEPPTSQSYAAADPIIIL